MGLPWALKDPKGVYNPCMGCGFTATGLSTLAATVAANLLEGGSEEIGMPCFLL